MKSLRTLILPVAAAFALAIPSLMHAQVNTTTDANRGEIHVNARFQTRITKDHSKQAKAVVLGILDGTGYAYADPRTSGDVMVIVNDDNTASVEKHMTGAWIHLIIDTPFNGTMYFFLPRNFSNDKDCINDPNWREMVALSGALTTDFNQALQNPSKALLDVMIPQ